MKAQKSNLKKTCERDAGRIREHRSKHFLRKILTIASMAHGSQVLII